MCSVVINTGFKSNKFNCLGRAVQLVHSSYICILNLQSNNKGDINFIAGNGNHMIQFIDN